MMQYRSNFRLLIASLCVLGLTSCSSWAYYGVPQPRVDKLAVTIDEAEHACKSMEMPPIWEEDKLVFYSQPSKDATGLFVSLGLMSAFVISLAFLAVKSYLTPFIEISSEGLTLSSGECILWKDLNPVTEDDIKTGESIGDMAVLYDIASAEEEMKTGKALPPNPYKAYSLALSLRSDEERVIEIEAGVNGSVDYEDIQKLVEVIQAYQAAYGEAGTGKLEQSFEGLEFDNEMNTLLIRETTWGELQFYLACLGFLQCIFAGVMYHEGSKHWYQSWHKLCTIDTDPVEPKVIDHRTGATYSLTHVFDMPHREVYKVNLVSEYGARTFLRYEYQYGLRTHSGDRFAFEEELIPKEVWYKNVREDILQRKFLDGPMAA